MGELRGNHSAAVVASFRSINHKARHITRDLSAQFQNGKPCLENVFTVNEEGGGGGGAVIGVLVTFWTAKI